MNCQDLLRLLTDYSDGVLDERVCRELERHLTECSHCAEVEQDLAALARICRSCASPRLPDDVRRRLEERLRG